MQLFLEPEASTNVINASLPTVMCGEELVMMNWKHATLVSWTLIHWRVHSVPAVQLQMVELCGAV